MDKWFFIFCKTSIVHFIHTKYFLFLNTILENIFEVRLQQGFNKDVKYDKVKCIFQNLLFCENMDGQLPTLPALHWRP